MAKVDITRFTFYAFRFMQSERIAAMTAEEVGQYVLLLCRAWLGGKNASLPSEPILLAQYARCAPNPVSEKVMAHWQRGEDGRLYDETLSEEWEDASGRVKNAEEKGRKGADAKKRKQSDSSATQATFELHSSGTQSRLESDSSNPLANSTKLNITQLNKLNSGTPPAELVSSSAKENSNTPIQNSPPGLGFNCIEGVSPAQVERVYLWHWKYSSNPFWKAKTPSVALFQHSWPELLRQMPPNWKPPALRVAKVYNPDCKNCYGEGGRNVGNPKVWRECECWKEHAKLRSDSWTADQER